MDVETVRVVRPARFQHVAVGEQQRCAVDFRSGPHPLEQAVVEGEHGGQREHHLGRGPKIRRRRRRFAQVADGRAFKRQRAARRTNGGRLPSVPLAHRAPGPMNVGVAVERRKRAVMPDLPPAVGEDQIRASDGDRMQLRAQRLNGTVGVHENIHAHGARGHAVDQHQRVRLNGERVVGDDDIAGDVDESRPGAAPAAQDAADFRDRIARHTVQRPGRRHAANDGRQVEIRATRKCNEQAAHAIAERDLVGRERHAAIGGQRGVDVPRLAVAAAVRRDAFHAHQHRESGQVIVLRQHPQARGRSGSEGCAHQQQRQSGDGEASVHGTEEYPAREAIIRLGISLKHVCQKVTDLLLGCNFALMTNRSFIAFAPQSEWMPSAFR